MAIFFFFLEAGNKVSFRDFHNLNCTFKMRENVCVNMCVHVWKERSKRGGEKKGEWEGGGTQENKGG